ncbi:cyclase family protein [Desulfoluna spongiiphila]|uniref:Kynurenine formamidase n=1 Tax=Desulfoluna spongiiphila TaxID=419481 RepID=A0A1G5ILP0_9BACT|nr:cyclase family protein [Desulfoluna spongiiphila]SCY76630.1 Kynurenine formamidase [Desulfoluna spongiiphila]
MKKRSVIPPVLTAAMLLFFTACASHQPAALQPASPFNGDIVDLTQPLTPHIPIWPGDPAFEVAPWATYEKDQYFINRIAMGEHSGTHWGTPNTFIKGARSAEMFDARELVVPAVVIDIRQHAEKDTDHRFSIDELKAWEKAQGKNILPGSLVILFTGWQDKWHDPEAFLGTDKEKTLHWPGFGADTAQFLVTKRGVVGLGTDTHGADPGNDTEFGASFAMYDADGMILECLTGLHRLPPFGSVLVIGGWPVKGGSGSPARVLAFVPSANDFMASKDQHGMHR